MQAVNIDLVDGHLEELEAELLQEYMANDRPPLPSMMFVSALSQMWVFAAYELLRTWRQRAREIMLVLDPSGRQNYIDSLTLMRDLDFNVLVPWEQPKTSRPSPPSAQPRPRNA
jgi:hypothetical protein